MRNFPSEWMCETNRLSGNLQQSSKEDYARPSSHRWIECCCCCCHGEGWERARRDSPAAGAVWWCQRVLNPKTRLLTMRWRLRECTRNTRWLRPPALLIEKTDASTQRWKCSHSIGVNYVLALLFSIKCFILFFYLSYWSLYLPNRFHHRCSPLSAL
jgi:hypothetical protein